MWRGANLSSDSRKKPDWKELIEKFNSLLDFDFRHEFESQLQEHIERFSRSYKEIWEKFSSTNVKTSIENFRKFFEKTQEGERLRTISIIFMVTLIIGFITAIGLRFLLIQNELFIGYSMVPATGIYGVIFAFYFLGAYLVYHYFTNKTWRQSLKKNREAAIEKLNKEIENIKAYIVYLNEFSKKITSEASHTISRIAKLEPENQGEKSPLTENKEIPQEHKDEGTVG
jgi:hypothetical protein